MVQLQIPGYHNILNALAAFVISKKTGLKTDLIIKGLEKYRGVKRRFEKKGKFNEALIVDDYAHHPTEIINTIKTAKRTNPNKLFVVFQPHRYSRTQNLMEEFSKSFNQVDELILTDIYSASEDPIEGVNSQKLFTLIKDQKNKNNLGILVRGGLAKGRLTERVVPYLNEIEQKEVINKLLELVNYDTDLLTALALKFLYKNKKITSVLIGSKNLKHIKKNILLLEKNIDEPLMKSAIKICQKNKFD